MPAQLYPTDFDLSTIDYLEGQVIKGLLNTLDDDWILAPNVEVAADGNDYEIDVILISRTLGVLCMEIKGGMIHLENGIWKAGGKPLRKDPVKQVKAAKHALMKRLLPLKLDLNGLFIQHVVAFPHLNDFPEEGAGPNCPRSMIFTGTELADPIPAIMRLERGQGPIPSARLGAFLKAIRPDVSEIEVTGSSVKSTWRRIDNAAQEAFRVVARLDENRRVHVYGGAGTGKTYLAKRWARRAIDRGEDTLFLCFNRILGQELNRDREELIGQRPNAPTYIVGSFHATLGQMLPDDAPRPPASPTKDYWDHEFLDVFRTHFPRIEDRFDTLILDEGQDIKAEWLTTLEMLLKDPENGKILMVADQRQSIYNENWNPPKHWTNLQLKTNLRNTREIANALERMGGARARHYGPPGPKIDFYRTQAIRETRKRVSTSIAYAVNEMEIPLSRILILTRHTLEREELRNTPLEVDGVGTVPIVAWAARDEGSVVCETIHATKGLEREAVILVNLDEAPEDDITYIGASRAIIYLAVIGRDSLGEKLGLVKS